MLPIISPQKRNCKEFQDPDYPADHAPTASVTNSKRPCLSVNPNYALDNINVENQLQRIQNVVALEFEREIALKRQQLELVNDRLSRAHLLLKRLRYAIVTEYYRKPEAPFAHTDAALREIQMSCAQGYTPHIHPSLKKIIGKRPYNYMGIMRNCPQRTAAQNAKQIIKIKTPLQRRQERHVQQLIREQGIVIDHSTDSMQMHNSFAVATNEATTEKNVTTNSINNSTKREIGLNTNLQIPIMCKTLNASRLNNKVKHLIVVGNTSKYIGVDINATGQKHKSNTQTSSHKWLVYIQPKGPSLNNLLTKVRFFLHPSYRPNDSVDICNPPFQLARRGWGEFPIRIQLFFRDDLQQKPVQLVHNLVLDKTHSGIHTLGAETLVEIWLRPAELQNEEIKSNIYADIHKVQDEDVNSSQQVVSTQRLISYKHNKEDLDDQLLEFLNKIGETPINADIEKIEPTILVTELLSPATKGICKVDIEKTKTLKLQSTSANVTFLPNSGPIVMPDRKEKDTIKNTKISPTKQFIKLESNVPCHNEQKAQCNINVINGSFNHETKCLPLSKDSANLVNSNSNIITPDANKREKLELLPNKTSVISGTSLLTGIKNTEDISKKIFTKKCMKVVDATGKIKLLQVLVATSPSNANRISSNSIESATINTTSEKRTNFATAFNLPAENRKVPDFLTYSGSCNEAAVKATHVIPKEEKSINRTTRNVVFQKRGKLYIIDPMQIKLKQQQTQQVSLLKPQVNQHRRTTQSSSALQAVACDHDYVPAPVPPCATTLPLVARTMPQLTHSERIQLSVYQKRLSTKNAVEYKLQQAAQFERHFQRTQVTSMRVAVEHLLRRLPLVATSYTVCAGAFPFIHNTLKQFQSLTALKQRAWEWLRAKCIARLMRHHKQLQKLDASAEDTFWSTREIVIFARFHAYCPELKALPQLTGEARTQQFTELVKTEIKHDQRRQELHYSTLTVQTHVSRWLVGMRKQLQQEKIQRIIEVDDVSPSVSDLQPLVNARIKYSTTSRSDNDSGPLTIFSIVEYLRNEIELVHEICRDLQMQLKPMEEVSNGVGLPLAQTLLAQCVRLFVQKLLQETIALKLQQEDTPISLTSNFILREAACKLSLSVRDIGQVITQNDVFRFLTNKNLGTVKFED